MGEMILGRLLVRMGCSRVGDSARGMYRRCPVHASEEIRRMNEVVVGLVPWCGFDRQCIVLRPKM